MWVGRDCQNSDVSHRAVRDLIVKIARYARYDGSILSTSLYWHFGQLPITYGGPELVRPSPSRPAISWNLEIFGFSDGHRRDSPKSVLRVGGPIFGKATKVAINPLKHITAERVHILSGSPLWARFGGPSLRLEVFYMPEIDSTWKFKLT